MPNNFFDTYDWNRAAQGLFIPPRVYGNAQSQAAREAWRQAHPFGPPRATATSATPPTTTTTTPPVTSTGTSGIGVKPNPFTQEVDNTDEYARNAIVAAMIARDANLAKYGPPPSTSSDEPPPAPYQPNEYPGGHP
jgi:hypothetical protein